MSENLKQYLTGTSGCVKGTTGRKH